MNTTRTVSSLLFAGALLAAAATAMAQTGMSTEGAMPQARSASGSASMANSNKAGKPAVDKMWSPMGTSKKPAKAGAQSGPASSPQ